MRLELGDVKFRDQLKRGDEDELKRSEFKVKRAAGGPQAPVRRKDEMINSDLKDQCSHLPLEGNPGLGLSFKERRSISHLPSRILFSLFPSPASEGSRLCLFVMHSTAIHKQIDINLCQAFMFKNMNYSRNITILIRNH